MAAQREHLLSPETDLVFLHGVNNTPATWTPVRERLGHRRSGAPCLPAVGDMSQVAGGLLDTLPPAFVVIGHSLGGYVALEILRQAPGRVAAIALVNSLDTEDSPAARERRAESATRAENGEYLRLAEAATAASYHRDNLADPRLRADRATALAAYGPSRFAAHQRAAASRADQRATLRAFAGPKLVVAGDDDRVIPPTAQAEMAAAVGASFETVPGAGHMLPAERPERLAAVLGAWLDELTAP